MLAMLHASCSYLDSVCCALLIIIKLVNIKYMVMFIINIMNAMYILCNINIKLIITMA